MDKKIKVKVIGSICKTFARSPSVVFHDRYDFTFDPDAGEYDWLVVYGDIPRNGTGTYRNGYEPLACPRAHTIYATNEPVTIKSYGKANSLQYRYFLTNRTFAPECHPGYRFGRGYYSWLTGRMWDEELKFVAPPKTKLISAICSAKHPKQAQYCERQALIAELQRRIPEIDRFGWGVRRLDHQYEAMDEYRYTIAVESHVAPGHWTEKIADALLCECLPFYAGDVDLGYLLPPESFIPIPIENHERAYRIIRAAIDNNEYEKRLPAIRAARKLLLEKYNFCEQVIGVIEGADPLTEADRRESGERIYERHVLRRRSPSALLSDAWYHIRAGR